MYDCMSPNIRDEFVLGGSCKKRSGLKLMNLELASTVISGKSGTAEHRTTEISAAKRGAEHNLDRAE